MRHHKDSIEFESVGRWEFRRSDGVIEFIGIEGAYQVLERNPVLLVNSFTLWSSERFKFGLGIEREGNSIFKFCQSGDIREIMKIDRSCGFGGGFRSEKFFGFQNYVILFFELGLVCFNHSAEHCWSFQHKKLVYNPVLKEEERIIQLTECDYYKGAPRVINIDVDTGEFDFFI